MAPRHGPKSPSDPRRGHMQRTTHGLRTDTADCRSRAHHVRLCSHGVRRAHYAGALDVGRYAVVLISVPVEGSLATSGAVADLRPDGLVLIGSEAGGALGEGRRRKVGAGLTPVKGGLALSIEFELPRLQRVVRVAWRGLLLP